MTITTKENIKVITRWLARHYDKEAEQAVFGLERAIDRLKHIEAVARRTALREATELCDKRAKLIEGANPGRKKGTIAQAAFDAYVQAQACGEDIWRLRAKTKVPT